MSTRLSLVFLEIVSPGGDAEKAFAFSSFLTSWTAYGVALKLSSKGSRCDWTPGRADFLGMSGLLQKFFFTVDFLARERGTHTSGFGANRRVPTELVSKVPLSSSKSIVCWDFNT